jgi:hypothetical protein
MQRLFAPAMILWLAAFGAAQAQTQTSSSPSPNTTTTGTSAPNSAASVTGPPVARQPVPGGTSLNDTSADPLNVPATTVPPSPSVNPQRAAQLPGETSNAATQAPNTTAASAPSVASSTPCTTSVPTTEGGSSMTGVFGGASGGGC